MTCSECGAIEVSDICRSCGAEGGYAAVTPLITSEWQEHAQVWEVLARSSADEPWTRLEGFDRGPLMKRAREIAFPTAEADQ